LRRVAVFGLGYAGLTFAAAVAYRGFAVTGFDVNAERVEAVNRGEAPFYEPGLGETLKRVVDEGRLRAVEDYAEAVRASEIVFIFVPTPSGPDGSVDLSYVRRVAEMIGEALGRAEGYRLVVVRSTVPPGTTEGLVKPVVESASGRLCGRDFGLAMNPEFIREGLALEDHLKPSRVVIGEYDRRSGDVLEEFYREFLGGWSCPILRVSTYEAELIKYASNAFLALRISFINSIARICERLPKCDIRAVVEAIGLDPRIGRQYLSAGLGFGGSCLPKDLRALIRFAEALGEDPSLFRAAYEVNEGQIDRAIRLLKAGLQREELKGVRVLVFGASFKPSTDDVRESPALKLAKRLIDLGAEVRIHDPVALRNAEKELGPRAVYCADVYSCAEGVDAVVIATDWPQYKELDLERLRRAVAYPLIFDGRRIVDPDVARRHGFKYLGIGLNIY